jgi:SRSO17 transposase
VYKTKPQLVVELIQALQHKGFRFEVVLTDSLYGESGDCFSVQEKLHRKYVGRSAPIMESGCH